MKKRTIALTASVNADAGACAECQARALILDLLPPPGPGVPEF